MLFILLILLCIVLLIVKFTTRRYNYWKKRNIPQAEDLIWRFILENRSMAEICKDIYDKYDVPHIGTSLGTTPALILKNIEDIQAVMAGDFQSFYKRGLTTNSNDILADNILFIENFQRWKLLRQNLSPVFTSLKLKNMFYIIERSARDLVKLVESNQEGKIQPFELLYTYTTASIGASVFGIDTQMRNTMDSPFLEMAWKSVRPSFKTNMTFFLSNMFPKIFKLLKLTFFGEHEEFFIGAVQSVFEKRRHSSGQKYHDFIETCLEIQKNGIIQDPATGFKLNATDELLAAQAFFFFIAGADVTANAMHFTLLELSNNPKILSKLHDEIDKVFAFCKDQLSYEDIDKLQYLEMVNSEAMRKYPPVGYIQRLCTKDTTLPTNAKIDKGTAVAIPVFGIHRDEKHYKHPEKFDPERFHPDNTSNINKFAYLPFGEGNRICIGARLARLQMKAGLAWLLRHFTLAEQNYCPKTFEPSSFGLRDPYARYDLILRNICTPSHH